MPDEAKVLHITPHWPLQYTSMRPSLEKSLPFNLTKPSKGVSSYLVGAKG